MSPFAEEVFLRFLLNDAPFQRKRNPKNSLGTHAVQKQKFQTFQSLCSRAMQEAIF
jgi:hypothetical protein